MGTTMKMGLATIAFAVFHSALATRRAKRIAAEVVGERRRDGGYRLFFVGQSLITFAMLIAYGARLPARTLYRAHGVTALALRAGQLAGMAHLVASARQVGISRLAGIDNVQAWQQGRPIPLGPFAQGPEIGADGRLAAGGFYRWSRHPLNFSGLPLFWLTPHMTTRRLAFNLVSTLYFIAGSKHEEARLLQAYGQAYRAYCNSAVPFFWPRPPFAQTIRLTSAVRHPDDANEHNKAIRMG